MLKRLYLPLLVFTMVSGTFAQDYSNPDDVLAECLTLAGDDGEIVIQCQYAAREAWDKEVARYYNLLLEKLPAEQQKLLRTAQAKWIAYRDSEMLFSGALYRSLEGGMWMIINAERTTEIHRKRANELMEYYEMLTFDPE